MYRSKAFRIHQHSKAKRRAKKLFKEIWQYPDWHEDERNVNLYATTPSRCSCWMCGNSRKYFGHITNAEKINRIDYREQLKNSA